jgi:hypothetical protein
MKNLSPLDAVRRGDAQTVPSIRALVIFASLRLRVGFFAQKSRG